MQGVRACARVCVGGPVRAAALAVRHGSARRAAASYVAVGFKKLVVGS